MRIGITEFMLIAAVVGLIIGGPKFAPVITHKVKEGLSAWKSELNSETDKQDK